MYRGVVAYIIHYDRVIKATMARMKEETHGNVILSGRLGDIIEGLEYEVEGFLSNSPKLGKFIKVDEPQEKLTLIKNDPTDNKILECAKEAKADFIVSGDIRHILVLKKFGKAKIIKAKDFLDEFYKQ